MRDTPRRDPPRDPGDTVFLTAAPIAAVGFAVVLFLRERPLRGATAR